MTTRTEHKSFRVEAKADAEPGEFTGYASVWGNVDSYGDVMVRGAFAESIAERGLPAISYEHNWDAAPIGVITAAVEDDKGLRVTGKLFIEHPDVSNIYQAMKAGGLTEMSFAFITKDASDGTQDEEPVRFVKAVDWIEAAVVWKGANDLARLVSVRSAIPAALQITEEDDARLAARINEAVTAAQAALVQEELLRTVDIALATPDSWEN